MKLEFASVRSEMGDGFALVRNEITGVRGELAGIRGEITGMRGEFVTQAMLQAQFNRLLLWLFPTLLTALALAFAVAKLS